MNTRKSALAAGMGLALSLAVGTAQAAVVELWSFEDDDIDFILEPTDIENDVANPITAGPLTVGQVFTSVFELGPFFKNGVDAIPDGKELVGVAAVQLQSIVPSPAAAGSVYTFGAYAGGLDAVLGLADGGGVMVPGGGAGGGAAVAMWFNDAPAVDPGAGGDRDLDLNRTSNPATNCTSLGDCLDQATRGDLFQVDGFGLDDDEFWLSTQILPGGGDIGAVLAASNTALVSGFNFALSNFFQTAPHDIHFTDIGTGAYCGNPGYILDGCTQVVGSGTITGGAGLSNGAIAHSDLDAQKHAVPEPAISLLFGLGLLGFGARFTRRKA